MDDFKSYIDLLTTLMKFVIAVGGLVELLKKLLKRK